MILSENRHRIRAQAEDKLSGIMPMQPQLAVSAAIFRDGLLLLIRRAREPARGLYTLPGGRVEWGETLVEAVRREVREETALDIDVLGLCGYREAMPRDARGQLDGHFVILPFAARWLSGEVALNGEADDARWVRPDQLSQFATTPGLAEIVETAARMSQQLFDGA